MNTAKIIDGTYFSNGIHLITFVKFTSSTIGVHFIAGIHCIDTITGIIVPCMKCVALAGIVKFVVITETNAVGEVNAIDEADVINGKVSNDVGGRHRWH